MKTLLLAVALFACGDNLKPGNGGGDGGNTDAGPLPATPTLGTQIDRMGRPAINTALNATFFDAADPAKAKKDAYNAADDAASWATTEVATGTTIVAEFSKNLAVLDIVDKGVIRTPPDLPLAGCGNSALYSGPPSPMSYASLATVLADDQLFVDTSKSSCGFYLSLEVEAATGGTVIHSQCGGRTLSHDVIDVSYSLLAAGLQGFGADFVPRITDDVPVHSDVDDATFPFLGPPHL